MKGGAVDEALGKIEMTGDQASAYAKLLQKIDVSDYRKLAQDDTEARLMFEAGEVIRRALSDVGVVPKQ
ncbi:MAG: hypothetical protein RLZ25_1078 [Pseudomonadota bacterium]